MAVGRGRFFVPVYVNPKYVSDDGMAVLAGLMRWARANEAILRNTIVLPSRPERGEPYAYAHWLDQRGLIAVRNPSNESKSYLLDLRVRRSQQSGRRRLLYAVSASPRAGRRRDRRL